MNMSSKPTPEQVYERYRVLGSYAETGVEFHRSKTWAFNQVKRHRDALAAGGSAAVDPEGPTGEVPVDASTRPSLEDLDIDALIAAAGQRGEMSPNQIRGLVDARRFNVEYQDMMSGLVKADSLPGTAGRIYAAVEKIFDESFAQELAAATGMDPAVATEQLNRVVDQLLRELDAEIPEEWR